VDGRGYIEKKLHLDWCDRRWISIGNAALWSVINHKAI